MASKPIEFFPLFQDIFGQKSTVNFSHFRSCEIPHGRGKLDNSWKRSNTVVICNTSICLEHLSIDVKVFSCHFPTKNLLCISDLRLIRQVVQWEIAMKNSSTVCHCWTPVAAPGRLHCRVGKVQKRNFLQFWSRRFILLGVGRLVYFPYEIPKFFFWGHPNLVRQENDDFFSARILVVCNKLEVGFDEPRLAALYLDRCLVLFFRLANKEVIFSRQIDLTFMSHWCQICQIHEFGELENSNSWFDILNSVNITFDFDSIQNQNEGLTSFRILENIFFRKDVTKVMPNGWNILGSLLDEQKRLFFRYKLWCRYSSAMVSQKSHVDFLCRRLDSDVKMVQVLSRRGSVSPRDSVEQFWTGQLRLTTNMTPETLQNCFYIIKRIKRI